MRWTAALWALTLATANPLIAQDVYQAHTVQLLMGTRFELGVYADSQSLADSVLEAGIVEVKRIEALISSWNSESQTSRINQARAGDSVRVDRELLALIARSQKISALTEGAFDITAGAGLAGLYRFAGQDTTLPDFAQLEACQQTINYRDVVVDRAASAVIKRQDGVQLGFGGIGKGYAANRVRSLMRNTPGVVGGVINAAGDLATFGTNAEGKSWTIAIADPSQQGKVLGQVQVRDAAVVTSGNYEKYFTHEGLRYSHIIDPRTCLPTTGVSSVTIVSSDAEIADALATACFVLGPGAATALIDRLKDIEMLLITEAGDLVRSRGLRLEPYVATPAD